MAKAPKPLENMQKNLTDAEREARAQAEAEIMPVREAKALDMDNPPRSLKSDAGAKAYWAQTLNRMEGLAILDDLDADMLSVYCSTLSRRDALNKLCGQLMRDSRKDKASAEDQLDKVSNLDTLLSKVLKHETQLLTYAEKLGLTPSGRVRLARQRAAAVAEQGEVNYLFGD